MYAHMNNKRKMKKKKDEGGTDLIWPSLATHKNGYLFPKTENFDCGH
jgi:hypothetical protein